MKRALSNALLPFLAGAVCSALGFLLFRSKSYKSKVRKGLEELIGETPLVFLKSLS